EPDPVAAVRAALGRARAALGGEPHAARRHGVLASRRRRGGPSRNTRLSARPRRRRARGSAPRTLHGRGRPRPGGCPLTGLRGRGTQRETHRRKEPTMAIRIGDVAPDFEQDSSEGRIKFHDWIKGKWAVLFSHPKDFTPVCTTELGAVAKLKAEFDKRNCRVIAVSVDDVPSHKGWIGDIEETQHTKMNFPILADPDRKVADLYGMIHPNANDTLTVRSVFFIDPKKKVRAMITYPASTGRNFAEILRVLDSLQLTDNHQVATPADWKQGDDCVIVPSLTDPEELKKKFPKGYKALKPYLRMTPQPNR